MEEKKPLYITTTLPYVNAEPHIGFALEILQADALARWARLTGREVFFNTGSDEHGQKIFEAAAKAGEGVQGYVDRYAASFERLKSSLNLSYDKFIRTTDSEHVKAAQEMWNRCKAKGDIYEKEFEGLYCVGCERFLTERDLEKISVGGFETKQCQIHHTEPQLLKEKNWFFKFSSYQEKLLEYLSNPTVVIPEWRREEAINFVKEGLEDFSISREKSRLAWGIPVPGDDTQVMYVWFDALTNYISTLGWPDIGGNFDKFWQNGHVLQLAGKDQVRFQSLMWQAMLMSADVKNTDQVFYHGFINSGGQKMSKSLGNVISPFELVEKYGTDATRYLLLRHVHSTEDTDVTWEKLDEWYTADLVNGLGNLVARVMQMASNYLNNPVDLSDVREAYTIKLELNKFEFHNAALAMWSDFTHLDELIQEQKPFEVFKKEPDRARLQLNYLVKELFRLAGGLEALMPETSKKIKEAIVLNVKPQNLFPRLNA